MSKKIKFPIELSYRHGKIQILGEDGFLHLVQDFVTDRAATRLLNDVLHEVYRQNRSSQKIAY